MTKHVHHHAVSAECGHVHEAHAGPGAHTCAHATAQAQRASYAAERAEAECRRLGIRLTPIRRKVLDILNSTHRPLGAYDIAEILGRDGDRRVAAITVYRALDFLLEHGFAHRLESRNAFIACPHEHGDDDLVVFLMCESCGGVDEAHAYEVKTALDGLARASGFVPRLRVIEIAGTCDHCKPA